MALDFKEIVLSWYDSLTSEDKKRPGQLELAQKRYSMCLGCEHFRPKRFLKNDSYCNDCGCPIKGKFTQENLMHVQNTNGLKSKKSSKIF
jgi:hypothetical protein